MKYLMLFTILLTGCSSTSSSNPSLRTRQDKALADPMNYSANVSESNNISGGGMTDLNKEALKKDLNSVFNP
jgi:hypothetical protein